MTSFPKSARPRFLRDFCCAALLCAAGASAQHSRPRHQPAPSPWEQATASRTEFEQQPASEHSRAAYTQVMDQFRAIYHNDPGDQHAAEAVENVAELLGEQGRELGDPASLKNAAGQYRFLEEQYPQSRAAKQAKMRLAELDKVASPPRKHLETASPSNMASTEASAGSGTVALSPSASLRTAAPTAVSSVAPGTGKAIPPENESRPAHSLALVSGIRHWSTSTYTRVAIDLGDEVTFQAARVPNPDRIYFDLHGAKLSPELVGKSFAVTDEGFLKRVRAAQPSGDVTRIVLDVTDVTDYSAFLLPNPYRLIIDIHGGVRGQATGIRDQEVPSAPVAATDPGRASAAANASGLPAMAPTDGGAAVRPLIPTPIPAAPPALTVAASENGRSLTAGRITPPSHVSDSRPFDKLRAGYGAPGLGASPVSGAVAVKSTTATAEVTAVSDAPGKVEATTAPTSKPIAAGIPVATPVNLGTGKRARKGKSPDSAVVGDALASTGPASPAKAADKTADGETSMIRALGLKVGRIVIDAGHGGHDSGTLGADGIEEKDVVLDVALRLGKLLNDRLGAQIVYTRSDDTFIPLETRTAIANKAQADLFLSIHANSSQDETARGVETYYLNFTSDPGALDVAARENAVGGQSVHQLSDLVKKITLKDKIAESREFASDVEGSLYAGLAKGNDGLKNRGVKKAPFVVLIGANMPSILAEISFVTNPKDATQLRRPEYRERVAESLYAGVAKYESGLAGVKTAPVQRAAIR